MKLSKEIIDRFNQAFQAARQAGEQEPTAMVLATSDGAGRVMTRTVLLKAMDEDGFVFFTNTQSRKGRQIAASPRVAATFLWKMADRQVHVIGTAEAVRDDYADAYFASRPRGSQIGAWASQQSRPLDSRETLLHQVSEYEAKFSEGEVPRPPHWTGFLIRPETVEFWHGRESRLHDRFLYSVDNGQWQVQRLYP